MQPATCPHCGMVTTAAALGRHAAICLGNPDNLARCKDLLTAHGNVGVTRNEYRALIKQVNAPAVTSLQRLTGATSWYDILAWFGLVSPAAVVELRTCPTCGKAFNVLGYAHHYRKCGGTSEAQAVAQAVVEETELIRYERRVLAYDEIAAQCLPVASVVDLGNGYVRCVLR